jgi:hypothetical protein
MKKYQVIEDQKLVTFYSSNNVPLFSSFTSREEALKAIEEFYGICKIDDKIINNVPYNCGNDVILEIRTI